MENPYELMYMAHLKDSYATKELSAMYYPMIMHIIRRYTKSEVLLNQYKDDLLLEGRLAVLQAVDSYRQDQNAGLSTFIKVLVERRIINEVRYFQRERRYDNLITTSFDYVMADNMCLYDVEPAKDGLASPEYYMRFCQAFEDVKKEIQTFTPKEREILNTIQDDSASYQSAADALGISVKAYDGRRQRVKEKLKKCLNKGY